MVTKNGDDQNADQAPDNVQNIGTRPAPTDPADPTDPGNAPGARPGTLDDPSARPQTTDTPEGDTPQDVTGLPSRDLSDAQVADLRARFLERGDPADVLALIDHYTS